MDNNINIHIPNEVLKKLIAIDRESTGKLAALAEIAGLDKTRAFIGADLSNQDLSGESELSGFDFSYANMKGVDFTNSNLTDIDFRYANLEGAVFCNSNLNNVNFTSSCLSKVSISEAYILNSSFESANLGSASICESTFDIITINEKTDLSSVKVSKLKIENSPELSEELVIETNSKQIDRSNVSNVERVIPEEEIIEYIFVVANVLIFPTSELLLSQVFEVVTIELDFDTDISDFELIPFDFEIATLVRDDSSSEPSWTIQREQGQARQYLETLNEAVALEMVAISGGKFQMGSLEDEKERYKYESPQHEVTVESFFIGKYPITQAQWRIVAGWPKVTRDLDLAFFEVDNRPVVRVSWYDAIEFCARLSAQTEREYRLPSEAEWEYACRAGTTTPFHFGETISTELANYGMVQPCGLSRANGTASFKSET